MNVILAGRSEVGMIAVMEGDIIGYEKAMEWCNREHGTDLDQIGFY